MELIYQRFWHSKVSRIEKDKVVSITDFLDTYSEIRTVLEIGIKDFLISDAFVETFRQKGHNLEEALTYHPPIQGIKAYFGAGRPVKEAMNTHPQFTEPVLENIMAVIQAEAYLYQEKGFETPQAYDDFWDEIAKGSCKYYSNREQVQEMFMDTIQPKQRSSKLFGRYRNVAVFSKGNDKLQVNINFSDSFHEMAIIFTCQGKEFNVSEVQGWMLRCPDRVCRQAVLDLQGIIGLDLAAAREKDITKRTGGGQGCTHLGLMMVDAAKALQTVRFE